MINNEIKNKVKEKIILSQIYNDKTEISNKSVSFNRIAVIACLTLIIGTGTVFSKYIVNTLTNFGKGVQTAVENEYVEEKIDDYMYSNAIVYDEDKKVGETKVGIKLKRFVLDQDTLFTEYEIKFDDNIKQYRDFSSHKIDGNVNYAYIGSFDIDTTLKNPTGNNLNALNGGIGEFIIDDTNNTITISNKWISEELRGMEKLNIAINSLDFSKSKEYETSSNLKLTGKWDFPIDIPEYMFNNKDIEYIVSGNPNSNLKVLEAKATATGFVVEIEVENALSIEKSKELQEYEKKYEKEIAQGLEFTKDYYLKLFKDEKIVEELEEYYNRMIPISSTGNHTWREKTEGCYIENLNKERFFKGHSIDYTENKFIDNNTKYIYKEVFEMTKFDATDTITLHLDYYSKPIDIILTINQ